jgi:16S rRNA G966 N2-methylase RsmD
MSTDIASFLEARHAAVKALPRGAAPITSMQRNAVIHGDCLDILPRLATGSVDFVLTDPPYLARYRSRDGRGMPNDDNDAWLKPAFAELYGPVTAKLCDLAI